jgi:RNA polymerase sigma-70 factor (ECF subfamily)
MQEEQSKFEELWLPLLDAAYNLAYLLVGRDQDAQNVVQEAYIRALKGFKRFRGGNARAWLLAIVRNTAYSWLGKHANELTVIPFDPAIHTTAIGKPLSESSQEARVQQLQEALKRLPVEFREILVLHDIEGWFYKQLASALHVPSGTIMSRLSRARQRLRQDVASVQEKESQNEL